MAPTDSRYLDATDDVIVLDFYETLIVKEEQQEAEADKLPLCIECGYRGLPMRLPAGELSDICPKCGLEGMQTGRVFRDVEFDELSTRLGINWDKIKTENDQ